MEYSKAVITFNAPPPSSSLLDITYNSEFGIREIFYERRIKSYHTKIGIDAADSAKNYYDAIMADYFNTGLFDITLSGNIVTIKCRKLNVILAIAHNNSAYFVDISIQNKTGQAEPIIIAANWFSRNSVEPDVSVYNTIATNVLATQVDLGQGLVNNSYNPFQFIATRGISYYVQVKDANNNVFYKDIKSPAVLNSGNIKIKIKNHPSGANVKFGLYDEYALILQYSLNGTSWVADNAFNGMLPGNYSVYVKDQFGVIASRDFTISQFNPYIEITNAYSYLSESMSIRFKRDEKWDSVDIYRNDNNTLACEENKLIPYTWRQSFKPEDSIKTQFLSNYENISVSILFEGNKIPVSLQTPISFIGLTDRRDGNLFAYAQGKAGVYFTSGNIYNYATGAFKGLFALNGELPEYVAKGNYMNIIGSGWFEIIDIIFDESRNADIAILDYAYVGQQKVLNVASLYNQNNYNVYEFSIDMAQFYQREFQVEIKQSSPGFKDYNYLSEPIYVDVLDNDYFEIQWSNLEDSNVFYSTGIKNKAYVNVIDFNFKNDSSVEINKTNQTSVLISTINYENKELSIDAVPTAIAKQLVQGLLHKNLCINKVRYIANESPEVTVIKNSNLHFITASLSTLGKQFK